MSSQVTRPARDRVGSDWWLGVAWWICFYSRKHWKVKQELKSPVFFYIFHVVVMFCCKFATAKVINLRESLVAACLSNHAAFRNKLWKYRLCFDYKIWLAIFPSTQINTDGEIMELSVTSVISLWCFVVLLPWHLSLSIFLTYYFFYCVAFCAGALIGASYQWSIISAECTRHSSPQPGVRITWSCRLLIDISPKG